MAIYVARFAEQAHRYDDMVKAMQDVVSKKKGKVTDHERDLLSVAYKNAVGMRRSALNHLMRMKDEHEKAVTFETNEMFNNYYTGVESELRQICTDILEILETKLIPDAEDGPTDDKVFYKKMKGDYNRFIAERKRGTDVEQQAADRAEQAYEAAMEDAMGLPATDIHRMGLCLNYSVFLKEVRDDGEKACTLASQALQDAKKKVKGLEEGAPQKRDALLLIQLLRDNLSLWTKEKEETESIELSATQDADPQDMDGVQMTADEGTSAIEGEKNAMQVETNDKDKEAENPKEYGKKLDDGATTAKSGEEAA